MAFCIGQSLPIRILELDPAVTTAGLVLGIDFVIVRVHHFCQGNRQVGCIRTSAVHAMAREAVGQGAHEQLASMFSAGHLVLDAHLVPAGNDHVGRHIVLVRIAPIGPNVRVGALDRIQGQIAGIGIPHFKY